MADFPRAMVAQEIIELGERGGDVLFTLAIDNIEPLASMRIVTEQEMALALVVGCSRGQRMQLNTRATRCNQE